MKAETERISIRAPLHPATRPTKPAGDMSARRARRDGTAGCRAAAVAIRRAMGLRIVILRLPQTRPFRGSRARGDLLAARLLLLKSHRSLDDERRLEGDGPRHVVEVRRGRHHGFVDLGELLFGAVAL